jgi:hypothetical protein
MASAMLLAIPLLGVEPNLGVDHLVVRKKRGHPTGSGGWSVWWPLAGVLNCPLGEWREPAIAAGWCFKDQQLVPLGLSGPNVLRYCTMCLRRGCRQKVSFRQQDYNNHQCEVLSYDQHQRQVVLAQGWAKQKINHRKSPSNL